MRGERVVLHAPLRHRLDPSDAVPRPFRLGTGLRLGRGAPFHPFFSTVWTVIPDGALSSEPLDEAEVLPLVVAERLRLRPFPVLVR